MPLDKQSEDVKHKVRRRKRRVKKPEAAFEVITAPMEEVSAERVATMHYSAFPVQAEEDLRSTESEKESDVEKSEDMYSRSDSQSPRTKSDPTSDAEKDDNMWPADEAMPAVKTDSLDTVIDSKKGVVQSLLKTIPEGPETQTALSNGDGALLTKAAIGAVVVGAIALGVKLYVDYQARQLESQQSQESGIFGFLYR